MREILFRGQIKFDNGEYKKGEWVYGELVTLFDGKEPHPYIYGKGEVRGETVGQFTGLTDKNGKKIFEGDCWLDTDDDYLVYVVEFRDGQFGFTCYGYQGVLMPYGFDEDAGGFGEIDFTPFTDWNMHLIEIIGNIHDNPELLESEVTEE